MTGFRSMLLLFSEKCRDQILNGWYTTVVNLFAQAFTREDRRQTRPPERFFTSSMTLMRNYILNMITQSLHEYVDLFRFPISECPYIEPGTIIYYDSLPHAPRFIVRLYQVQNGESKDGSIVEFEPPLNEISEAVLEGVHNILDTINSIPLISKVLYGVNASDLLRKVALNAAGNNGLKPEPIWDVLVRGASEDDPNLLHIKVETTLIEEAEAELKDYCLRCFEVVEEYVLKYQVYQNMYSVELEKSMDEFFAQEHSFTEYCLVSLFTNRNTGNRKVSRTSG
jgi:hypothetical protein